MLDKFIPGATRYHVQENPFDDEGVLRKGLVRKDEPSLGQLLASEGVKASGLPGKFARKVRECFQYADKNSSIIDTDLNPQIEFIYKVWHATRDIPCGHELATFSRGLDSFDSFLKQYGQGQSRQAVGNLMQRIDVFVRTELNILKLVDVFPEGHRRRRLNSGIYNYEGDWIRLPGSRYYVEESRFADREVLQEIVATLDRTRSAGLFHATGSAALEGIGRHGAILSARRARELGEPIKTGEYNTYIGWNGFSVSGGEGGLGNVYTLGSLSTSYALVRWFDEFDVVFGLSRERMERYLRDEKGHDKFYLSDFAGEGIRVGPEAPLKLVETVNTEVSFVPFMKNWVDKHAPHIQVRSLEADDLRNSEGSYGRLVDWKMLLQKKPVTLRKPGLC